MSMPTKPFGRSFPRTHHLYGSRAARGDRVLSQEQTEALLARRDVSFVWESKLDGTNVGLWFEGRVLRLKNRNHVLGAGEHPQYGPLKAWAGTFADDLQRILGEAFVLYGEWCYAVHTIRYGALPHYFHAFDLYSLANGTFQDSATRGVRWAPLIARGVFRQAPLLRKGPLTLARALALANGHSVYGEEKAEGLYLKLERDGEVVGRYKLVRKDLEQVHAEGAAWRHRPLRVQLLANGVDIFRPKSGEK